MLQNIDEEEEKKQEDIHMINMSSKCAGLVPGI